jgi:ABC-type antimicrobial peptide transport system permease subunit
MGVKRTRSFITIGGMSIGIGAIVFLVSIGYGLQNLVISRVAKLEELKQADVMPSQASNLFIDDEVLNRFKEIPKVEKVFPLISLVGRINFKNSVTDIVVHGVTRDYLEKSALKPVNGKLFTSNETAIFLAPQKGEVAGEWVEVSSFGQEIGEVNFKIDEGKWLRVREKPSVKSRILGYTRRVEGIRDGIEVWGGEYFSETGVGKEGESKNGQVLGKWIKARVPLWKKEHCDSNQSGCEGGRFKILYDEVGKQVWEEGYFAEVNLSVEPSLGQVLGIVDETIASSSSEEKKETVSLGAEAKKEAVVNQALVQILGLEPNKALGEKITISFVVVGSLMPEKGSRRIESHPEDYTIVGVVPGEKNPVVWVPFVDLRSLGITHYSQATVTVVSRNNLSSARRQIEAMGYKTVSVADTVSQIKNLFGTIRLLLAALGAVALAVASLGMFNTLTVSLLERTREVGVMKAMGMKGKEVRDLFLTESMIMGFFGGVLGIVFGLGTGKALGLLISMVTLAKKAGFIDIASLPLVFAIIIVFLSLVVGFVTGIYPAKRATKISALDALRYE